MYKFAADLMLVSCFAATSVAERLADSAARQIARRQCYVNRSRIDPFVICRPAEGAWT